MGGRGQKKGRVGAMQDGRRAAITKKLLEPRCSCCGAQVFPLAELVGLLVGLLSAEQAVSTQHRHGRHSHGRGPSHPTPSSHGGSSGAQVCLLNRRGLQVSPARKVPAPHANGVASPAIPASPPPVATTDSTTNWLPTGQSPHEADHTEQRVPLKSAGPICRQAR